MMVTLRTDRKESADSLRLQTAFSTGMIYACDFYVPNIEIDGREVVGGYELGRIVNVDHHAPTRRMERRISSAVLAIERVEACGRPHREDHIVINHTDCDSVLTAGILGGDLGPEKRFEVAAVAADHTGEQNPIADLLQGLRHHRDYALSMRNLKLLLLGEPLEKAGQDALEERERRRQSARLMLANFRTRGQVAYGEFDDDLDGELFLPILPEAAAILLSVPSKKGLNPRDMKLWLGSSAPDGLSLHDLRMNEFDPAFGGRWNAGSNRRGGGTSISLETYAAVVAQRVDGALRFLHG